MRITIDFMKLLTKGSLGNFTGGETEEEIIKFIGQPEIYTPERKSYPAFVIYGDLEFRLRKNKIETVVITLNNGTINMPDSIEIENFNGGNGLTIDFIKGLLSENGVSWTLDSVMSDQYQANYVSDKGVHFAFDLEESGVLTKIGIEYKLIANS
ncbi:MULTISPECIES: hypothetical protein [Bacillales]|uniref:hypothetical protein n=1 Tax=Bacillales TaxID=1385 RepID=UPI00035D3DAA|nr:MULTISPECIES: hypothetical protein [Bacillales]KMZ41857.1 hypothetical protein AC624_12575 [Bacillus sp. FJAT-27238]